MRFKLLYLTLMFMALLLANAVADELCMDLRDTSNFSETRIDGDNLANNYGGRGNVIQITRQPALSYSLLFAMDVDGIIGTGKTINNMTFSAYIGGIDSSGYTISMYQLLTVFNEGGLDGAPGNASGSSPRDGYEAGDGTAEWYRNGGSNTFDLKAEVVGLPFYVATESIVASQREDWDFSPYIDNVQADYDDDGNVTWMMNLSEYVAATQGFWISGRTYSSDWPSVCFVYEDAPAPNDDLEIEMIAPDVNVTTNTTINFVLNVSDADFDNIISCDYRSDIDGFIGNDTSVTEGVLNPIDINPATFDQQHIYNFTCYEDGGSESVVSSLWDIYVNKSITISWDDELPDDDTHYNFSFLPVSFYFQANDTEAGSNIAACYLTDGSVEYDVIVAPADNTNYSLNVSSFAAEGSFNMVVMCDGGAVNETSTTKIIVYDVTDPDIPLFDQEFPLADNTSQAPITTAVPLNMSCGDENELWSFRINISINDIDVWNFYIEDLNVTNYTYDTPLDMSGFSNGSALTQVECYDSHTVNEIKPYYYEEDLKQGMISFHAGESKNVILIQAKNTEGLVKLETSKLIDRYNYEFDFSNKQDSKEGLYEYQFYVYSNREVKPKSQSSYKAHFIVVGEEEGNWIDSVLVDDTKATYERKKINDNLWEVTIKTKLNKLGFSSVGGLNKAENEARFYLGSVVELISPANGTRLTDETVSFNCSAHHFDTIDNITLFIDDVANETIAGTSNLTFLEEDVNLLDGEHNWTCHAYDGEGYLSTTSNSSFSLDTNPPVLTLNTAVSNATVIILPYNATLDVTSTDINLDKCYYNTSEDTGFLNYGCSSAIGVAFDTSDNMLINYCANDTFGNEACGQTNFSLYYIRASMIQDKEVLGEGEQNDMVLFVNMTPANTTFDTNPVLIWNNTVYDFSSKTSPTSTSFMFDYSFIVSNESGSLDGNNVTFSFHYGVGEFTNLTQNSSQTIYKMGVDDCTDFSLALINYTLRDEETRSFADIENGTIETDVTLSSLGDSTIVWEYSTRVNTTNETHTLDICITDNAINYTSYALGVVTRYEAYNHVVEYHYIDGTITNTSIPFLVDLHDLLTADSTSFLINFQDENYLPVEAAIVDVSRYYVGDGIYLSVEHGLTDDQGQTRLHLVTEDVKYIFTVRKDGEVLWISPEYLALCQATPCQINLRRPDDVVEIGDIGGVDNLVSSLSFDSTTRVITFTYATEDGATAEMEMNVVLESARLNDSVCSESQTSSSGSLTCTVPEVFGNTTFYVNATKDGSFVTNDWFSLRPTPFDTFGYTGVIMLVLLFLSIVLMAVTDGIAVIVFGTLGLAFAIPLTLFSGSIIGPSSAILWLIVAGGIIIYKISQKKRI